MKAIVQSCDRYHIFAEHMILKYQELWPSNPFTFRVPWNKKTPIKITDKFGEKIELIKTDVSFKDTFHNLTKDLDDDEWVFWSIDDKYPVKLNESKANQVLDFVCSIKDTNVINVCLHFFGQIKGSSQKMQKENRGIQINFKNLKYIEHNSFRHGWLHQFFRVKALREFWSHINEPDQHQAKSMDYDVRPLTGTRLTIDHKMCTYGESSSRGFITSHCLNSCKESKIKVPSCFTAEIRNAKLL
jgi:hypothetical protein